MTTEARKPPPQIALKIRRLLGGKAGWNGIAVQFAFAAILGWIGYEIVSNARAKAELGWTLRYPTWREGLTAIHAAEQAGSRR